MGESFLLGIYGGRNLGFFVFTDLIREILFLGLDFIGVRKEI